MAKFRNVESMGVGVFEFYCQGCECFHNVWTNKNEAPCWNFNGDVNFPTISPSILVTRPLPVKPEICHSFINNGKIQYLSDCSHSLKGQTIDLTDLA